MGQKERDTTRNKMGILYDVKFRKLVLSRVDRNVRLGWGEFAWWFLIVYTGVTSLAFMLEGPVKRCSVQSRLVEGTMSWPLVIVIRRRNRPSDSPCEF